MRRAITQACSDMTKLSKGNKPTEGFCKSERRGILNHATFKEKGINTGLVGQAWRFSHFDPA